MQKWFTQGFFNCRDDVEVVCGVNGAEGWGFHPAFMALRAIVFCRPLLLDFTGCTGAFM
jgi:hypothetical protein